MGRERGEASPRLRQVQAAAPCSGEGAGAGAGAGPWDEDEDEDGVQGSERSVGLGQTVGQTRHTGQELPVSLWLRRGKDLTLVSFFFSSASSQSLLPSPHDC